MDLRRKGQAVKMRQARCRHSEGRIFEERTLGAWSCQILCPSTAKVTTCGKCTCNRAR